ncbi:MAG: hypothetical protein KDC67_13270, partial [Ignavibacteriae bacterium]|nr:hypothetical protein [Ignavibacteriota bacterium]
EVVLKSTTQKLLDTTHTNMSKDVITGYVDARKYNVNDSYYTFVRIETGTFHKAIPELFQHYNNILKGSNIETKIELDKKSISIKNTDESIKIISIQPASYNSKIKSTSK